MHRKLVLSGILFLGVSGMIAFISLARVARAAPAVTIIVDSAADDPDASGGTGACATVGGECTLRAAIETAQAQPGADVINFSADFIIDLTGSLPELVETDLTIDGTGHTVHVNGGGLVENVFRINGQGVAIKNLRIYGSGSGFANIWIREDGMDNEIANNLIGDDDPAPGGCGDSSGSQGGIYISSLNTGASGLLTAWIYGNTIECHTASASIGITILGSRSVFIGMDPDEIAGPAQQNIIRDNGVGIVVAGSEGFNFILNNHILENGTGIWIASSGLINVWANIIENNDNYGVEISASTGTNLVGCNPFEDNETAARNYIRGNGASGVYISGASSENNLISCNWIGVADDGLTAAPNDYGIYITDSDESNWVISNTLSGNTLDGLRIASSAGYHQIISNTIGLDPSGMHSLPNGQHGIGIVDDIGDNIIGANLIGSNTNFGVYISNSPATSLVDNMIGVAKDGLTPRGNGFDGVYVLNSEDTQFGSLFSPSPQIIANNGENGIFLENATSSQIYSTTYVLDNDSHGVYLFQTVGSYVSPQRVSGNGSAGIRVAGNSAINNLLLPQEIYGNHGLPIELAADGLEPNDPGDADTGPNGLLNYPEVTATNGTVVTGTATMGAVFVSVYEILTDPTLPGGGGYYHDVLPVDPAGNWSVDLEEYGLAYKPVAFAAHAGTPDLFMLSSSPLSPITRLGYSLYLPVVQKD